MRPIKFRYVYKDLNGNILTDCIHTLKQIEEWDVWNYLECCWSHGYELLGVNQFTWLLDKNGKEIYEGDIVAFKYCWPIYIWEVSFNKFFHSCIKVWEKEYHIDNAMIWEIIGNIYENPELLNQ